MVSRTTFVYLSGTTIITARPPPLGPSGRRTPASGGKRPLVLDEVRRHAARSLRRALSAEGVALNGIGSAAAICLHPWPYACESHTVCLMSSAALTENAIGRWHEVVNSKDLDGACRAVSDPIVVNGPKGVGPITPAGFADWITRSGIEMRAKSWHPINDRVMLVEQEARWPQSKGWSRLATVFRATDDRVSAALRFPDLRAALTFAYLCAELAATE